MNYLQLDFKEVLEKYPQSLKKIINWFLSREDINTYIKRENPKVTQNEIVEIVKNMVSMVIQHDPRKLLDLFDSFGIYINIFEKDGSWIYYISSSYISNSADSRIEAEKNCMIEAFTELEKRNDYIRNI